MDDRFEASRTGNLRDDILDDEIDEEMFFELFRDEEMRDQQDLEANNQEQEWRDFEYFSEMEMDDGYFGDF